MITTLLPLFGQQKKDDVTKVCELSWQGGSFRVFQLHLDIGRFAYFLCM